MLRAHKQSIPAEPKTVSFSPEDGVRKYSTNSVAKTAPKHSSQEELKRYETKYDNLLEEINCKLALGNNLIEKSDRTCKVKVLYQEINQIIEYEIPALVKRARSVVQFPPSRLDELLNKKSVTDQIWLEYINEINLQIQESKKMSGADKIQRTPQQILQPLQPSNVLETPKSICRPRTQLQHNDVRR